MIPSASTTCERSHMDWRLLLFGVGVCSLLLVPNSGRAQLQVDTLGVQLDVPNFYDGGRGADCALDRAGRLHLVYTAGDDELHYSEETISGWQSTVLDSASYYSSIAMDNTGAPYIGYANIYIDFSDSTAVGEIACTRCISQGWKKSVVESRLPIGIAITVDASAVPYMAYWATTDSIIRNDAYEWVLKVAKEVGVGWEVTPVDTLPWPDFDGIEPYLAVDQDGTVHLAYRVGGALSHARVLNGVVEKSLINGFSKDVGGLVLDSLGHPHVSFGYNSTAYYARQVNGFWVVELVDSGIGWGWATDIALDSADRVNVVSGAISHSVRLGENDWTTEWFTSHPTTPTDQISWALSESDAPHFVYVRNRVVYTATVQGTTSSSDAIDAAGPTAHRLRQNYPNPMNPTTTIEYSVARGGNVSVQFHDAHGRLVLRSLEGHKAPGHHVFVWDGRDALRRFVGSGVYFYSLHLGDALIGRRRLVIVR